MPTLTAATARTLTLTPAGLVTASAESRTLRGYAATWRVVGNTSIGPVRLKAGALEWPAELRTVKLVDEHRTPPVAIGYCTAAAADDIGAPVAFHIGRTPDGDRALLEAAEGVRDSFSVELADLVFDEREPDLIVSARVSAVALVTTPAFAGSVVTELAAAETTTPPTSHPDERETTMTDEQRARLEALRTQETLTQDEAAELAQLAQLEHEAPTGEAETPAETPAAAAAAHRPAATAAAVPSGLHVRGGAAPVRRPLAELYAASARVLTGQSRPDLEAALSNITNTANIWTAPDTYAGELWSGVRYSRRWVSMFSPGKLTSYKVNGWRWVVRPEVDDYAGDKTAVPSNVASTEPVEVTAARLAGAHDIDRKFTDFGDTTFIASYFDAMTESYAVKSDLKARAQGIAAGAANVSATVATSLLHALLVAKVELETYEDDGFAAGSPDYYIVNSTDYIGLLDTTNDAAPAYLKELGIDFDKIRATAAQPAGTITAGVKAAGTFYELGETPIRVEALNIANGGVDGGVFGYWAGLQHHVKGVLRVTFVAPV
jgi:hypothetical protein